VVESPWLAKLAAVQLGQTAVHRPLVGILDDGGRGVGVDDGDGLARAIEA
jgi:hypothetical protein